MNIPLNILDIIYPDGDLLNDGLMKYLDSLAKNGNETASRLLEGFTMQKSIAAKKSADARHNQPGGTREKHEKIKALWATGKYKSRNDCAEKECAALAISYETARKALRNTPSPKKDCLTRT